MGPRYGSSILECLNPFQVKDLGIDIVLKTVMNISSMALKSYPLTQLDS